MSDPFVPHRLIQAAPTPEVMVEAACLELPYAVLGWRSTPNLEDQSYIESQTSRHRGGVFVATPRDARNDQ
jgi:hypothetical protein